ncbi:MAG: hypothetical protein PF437_09905 [Sulfurimonas sp.]|nr:hypothetical protein [Sulfurimonas sp.]
MEFFHKHKVLIFRSAGIFMLLVGFVVHFWVTPKEGFTKNEIAAANVARMEANVVGASSSSSSKSIPDTSKYLEELKNAQAKQMQYLTIIAMISGIGFLGYSFMRKT